MAEKFESSSEMYEDEKEIENAYKEGGFKHLVDTMLSFLGSWKETSLNIGVTGRSGVGKASFINTIRGIECDSPNSAPIGTTETTRQCKAYPHPDNKKLVFWDLPGIGTTYFSRDTYFKDERVQFDRYDMFLILTQGRIFEDDVLLAETAKEKKKPLFWIRTKVDIDVYREKRAKPLHFRNDKNATEKLLKQLRSEVTEGLGKEQKENIEDSVFLIDCHDMTWNEYDFGKLIERLIVGINGLKREALFLTLNILQPNVLEQKLTILRDQIWRVSAASAFGAAVPVPGCSFAVDVALIAKTAIFYRTQLGLTQEHIAKAAEIAELDVEDFKIKLDLQHVDRSWTVITATSYLTKYGATQIRNYVVRIFFSCVGSVYSAYMSYKYTTVILKDILDEMESDAKKLHSYMLKLGSPG